MRKIIVIGTIHNYPSCRRQLKQILKKLNPDQVLVEIIDADLKKRKFKNYPKEFIDAYEWAVKNKKIINGFDVPIRIEKPFFKKELRQINRDMANVISKHDWKEWNKSKYDDEIYGLTKNVIYVKKHKLRQRKMLVNIKRTMIPRGKILVLTGIGHLNFFERYLKIADFLFRR